MKRQDFWKAVQRALGMSETDIDGVPGPRTYGELETVVSVEITFEREIPGVIEGKPPWITQAEKYIGTKEIEGREHNPQVIEWWKFIGEDYVDDETPWCAAYVGGILEEIEIRSTRSGWARSYRHWGQECEPTLGAIAVFKRGDGGHVGFVMGVDASGDLMILGGNQSNAVNISPFSRTHLIATRWPKDYEVPENVCLPQLE